MSFTCTINTKPDPNAKYWPSLRRGTKFVFPNSEDGSVIWVKTDEDSVVRIDNGLLVDFNRDEPVVEVVDMSIVADLEEV